MKDRPKSALVKPDMTIREVMTVIAKELKLAPDGPGGIALVVDKNNKLLGIVTDGDIRRAIVKGADLNVKIKEIYNSSPVTFSKNLTPDELLTEAVKTIKKRGLPSKKINIIITLDDLGRPFDIFHFFELWQKAEVKTRTVSIIGLGYVGLTLALTLAEAGFSVVGVDIDKRITNNLKLKKSHIHEQGIDSLLERHINKNFFVRNEFNKNDSDVYIICVGTPVDEKGQVITRPLRTTLHYLSKILKRNDLVILRSTVPVGTCRNLVIPELEKRTKMKAGDDFFVSFAPERTVEGEALKELKTLPQIIGGLGKHSVDLTVKLFNSITDSIVLVDNLESAEMVKLLNNAYRDLTFSFANEVALICDKYNLNSHKVITSANYGYSRSLIPLPSPGVGGYCLTKDPYILASSARNIGTQAKLSILARKINNQMIDYVCQKVHAFVKQNRKNRSKIKIYVIGLAFKGRPETSDMRGSTSVAIIKNLREHYRNIVVYDPVIKKKEIEKAGFRYSDLDQGFHGTDCVLVLNDHRSYLNLNIYDLLAKMKKPGLFFDAWQLFSKIIIKPIDGISYRGI
jgi:nucleotide sugar dehydrogenase